MFSRMSNIDTNLFDLGYLQINTDVDPKEAYKEPNQKLNDMGFTNDELNFVVLKDTKGNVDLAVREYETY
jgi:hypothetical protein